jgi:hypothetical protein
MLYVLISVLIMAALLDRSLRRGRVELLLLEMRFKLFALRDELRLGVIDGTMPNNNWFEYLDTSITKTIDLLPTITVWEAVGLVWRYKNTEEIQAAQRDVMLALSEEVNKPLATIYAKFLVCIIEILVRRHVGIRYGMTGLAKVVVGARGLKEKAASIITVAPETSTYYQYVSQSHM